MVWRYGLVLVLGAAALSRQAPCPTGNAHECGSGGGSSRGPQEHRHWQQRQSDSTKEGALRSDGVVVSAVEGTLEGSRFPVSGGATESEIPGALWVGRTIIKRTAPGVRHCDRTSRYRTHAPLCDITGPWTVTRSSLRMLRRVAAFCRPLRPVPPPPTPTHTHVYYAGCLWPLWNPPPPTSPTALDTPCSTAQCPPSLQEQSPPQHWTPGCTTTRYLPRLCRTPPP